MQKYVCNVCGYEYDPAAGDPDSAIASGLEDEGVPVRIIDIQKNHHSDVMTELADCGAVIVGSATHNNNVLPGIADVLTYMTGLRPLNRVGAAFGSYGWSGESPKNGSHP